MKTLVSHFWRGKHVQVNIIEIIEKVLLNFMASGQKYGVG